MMRAFQLWPTTAFAGCQATFVILQMKGGQVKVKVQCTQSFLPVVRRLKAGEACYLKRHFRGMIRACVACKAHSRDPIAKLVLIPGRRKVADYATRAGA